MCLYYYKLLLKDVDLDGKPNVETRNADLVFRRHKLGDGKNQSEQSYRGCRGEEKLGTFGHTYPVLFLIYGKFFFYQVHIMATMAAAADPCLSFLLTLVKQYRKNQSQEWRLSFMAHHHYRHLPHDHSGLATRSSARLDYFAIKG